MINENLNNNKENSNLEENADIKKYIKFGEILKKNVFKNIDNKLINLKSKTGINIFNKEINKNSQNFISFPVTEKNISYLTIKNNSINIRRSDIPLPRLNKLALKRKTNSLERQENSPLYKNASLKRNSSLIMNIKNNSSLLYKNSLMNKEENNNRNNSSNNKIIFNSDLSNTSLNKNFMKIPKKFKIHKISRNYLNPESQTILRNHNMTPSSSTRIIHPILGLKKVHNHTLIKNSSLSNFKKIIANSPKNNLQERDERLNLLNSIFKTKGSDITLNFTGKIPFKKEIQLSAEIFRNNYKNFSESKTSKNEDIFNEDIIKGFAYNSSIGNIRSYKYKLYGNCI